MFNLDQMQICTETYASLNYCQRAVCTGRWVRLWTLSRLRLYRSHLLAELCTGTWDVAQLRLARAGSCHGSAKEEEGPRMHISVHSVHGTVRAFTKCGVVKSASQRILFSLIFAFFANGGSPIGWRTKFLSGRNAQRIGLRLGINRGF